MGLMVKSRIVREGKLQFQALVFLLFWPLVNLVMSLGMSFFFDIFSMNLVLIIALKYWSIFALSLIALKTLEYWYPRLFFGEKFWKLLLIHTLVIIPITLCFLPIIPAELRPEINRVFFFPLLLIMLEIVAYVSLMHIFSQEQRVLANQITMQQSELNVLRSQTNPHFLFNTLNLIVSEISLNPHNAKELVYELSDLLRSSIKLSKQNFTTVREELKLVSNYLYIQQKRFPDRLSFELYVSPDCRDILLPSLLLQPVVENTIKHAVAPYFRAAKVTVVVRKFAGVGGDDGGAVGGDVGGDVGGREYLQINVKDTGPKVDTSKMKGGEGSRILRQTLQLLYPGEHHISFESTVSGGLLILRFPVKLAKSDAVSEAIPSGMEPKTI